MRENSSIYTEKLKRLIDIILVLAIVLLTLPITLLISLFLKILGHDVFFKQKRIGINGKRFFLYKFTTMPIGSEKLGWYTPIGDPRPFKFGKLLRKAKLNELPQLINVILGEMSLVGPRPLASEQIEDIFNEDKIAYFYRSKPGITGMGSVYFHDEDTLLTGHSDTAKYYKHNILPKKMALEEFYHENCSLLLDVKIILATIAVILFKTPFFIDFDNIGK